MTKYFIDEGNFTSHWEFTKADEFINSFDRNNQPKFTKHIFRASLESKFSQNAGIIAGFTTTQSYIPLIKYYQTDFKDFSTTTQKRQSYNLFVKGHYDIGETLRLEGSYAYMPQFNTYNLNGLDYKATGSMTVVKVSDFTYRTVGITARRKIGDLTTVPVLRTKADLAILTLSKWTSR